MVAADEGTRRLIRNELKDAMDTYHMCYNVQVTNFLTDLFSSYDKEKIRTYVDKIATAMRSGGVEVKALSLESLKVILAHLSAAKDENSLKVINVFKENYTDEEGQPKKKSFLANEKEICHFQGKRLLTLKRLLENRRNTIKPKYPGELRNIHSLYGYSKIDNLITVLGCAYTDNEYDYRIEDHESMVYMMLSKKCEYGSGILAVGCPLMFTGHYKDGVLKVVKIELPPIVNIPKEVTNQRISVNEKIIFLSELNLDNSEILNAFHQLLSGFSQSPPRCLVMMGNFLKSPSGTEVFEEYGDGFRRLGNVFKEILSLYPVWKEVKLVFVSGDQDLPSTVMYPRLPISQCFRKYLNEKLDVTFTSNPTVITNKGQRMVVCRSSNVVEKMCRGAFHLPEDITQISSSFIETIFRMRHIQPLPNYISPISPAYDDLFSLETLPDLVVIGDSFKSYSTSHGNCLFVNPGQFSKASGFEFLVYYPHDKACEYSNIS